MPLLSIQNVSKSYDTEHSTTHVLDNVQLEIEEGEFVAIVGFSGAGKTTLISLIAGLIKPTTGTITLNGKTIQEPGPDRGIVFQNYSLLPWLTVYENIELAVTQVFSDWPEDKRRAHIERHIEMVNLTRARDKQPSELSGGMRQRVSVARALAMDPKILLLDEPLSALDALTRATLQDEISKIWQASGKTVVLITNDPDEGIYLADRIIPLSAGPRATLGPSIPIDIPRPRDRKAMNHHPRFKELRKQVTDYLLNSKPKQTVELTRKLVLPDIEPEDLSLPRPMMGGRRTPIRRKEIKSETVQVES